MRRPLVGEGGELALLFGIGPDNRRGIAGHPDGEGIGPDGEWHSVYGIGGGQFAGDAEGCWAGTVVDVRRHPTKDESFVILRCWMRVSDHRDGGNIIGDVELCVEEGLRPVATAPMKNMLKGWRSEKEKREILTVM